MEEVAAPASTRDGHTRDGHTRDGHIPRIPRYGGSEHSPHTAVWRLRSQRLYACRSRAALLSARRPRRAVRGLGRAFLYLSLSIYLPTQALAAIAERFLPEGYFSEDLRGVYMDQHLAFAVFLPHRLPRLAAHFTKLEFPLTLIGLRWFLCLSA